MNAPKRLVELSDSPAGALLRRVPAPTPPVGAVERNWRGFVRRSEAPAQPPSRFAWFAAGAIVAGLCALVLRPVAPTWHVIPEPGAQTVALSDVKGAQLDRGRVHVRAGSERVELRTALEVAVLEQAAASFEIAADGSLTVHVESGEVVFRPSGTVVRAGETRTFAAPEDDHARFRRALSLRGTDPAAAAKLFRTMANERTHAEVALYELARLQEPAAAVRTLEEARARFPGGALKAEVGISLVEALLATAQHARALEVLDGIDAPERRDELEALRGELLRAEGRWAEAAAVLQPLARGASPFAERALVLLAEVESRRGRIEQARAALREYLARFPNGAHAAAARASLGKF